MADSVGINAVTGRVLTDWEHVEQSIGVILRTPKGSRVMRRDFGSNVPSYTDMPMTEQIILAIMVEAATALAEQEPRFVLRGAGVQGASADGKLTLAIRGSYYPRGHLGDFSVEEDKISRVVFR